MEATTIQIILIIAMTLGLIGFSMGAYLWSVKNNKIGFYSYTMMLLIIVQWMSDVGSSLIYHNYYLHLASVIVFPSIIFSLFVCYVLQGYRSVKQLLYILLIGEVEYFLSILCLHIIGVTPNYIQVTWPWISNHLFSSIALIIDYFFLIFAWPYIHNMKYKLPLFLKVFISFCILLIIDSIIFTAGTFWGNPMITEIINANLIVRITLSIIITPFISLYLQYIITKTGHNFEYRHWENIINGTEEQQKIIEESKEKVSRLEKLEYELVQKNIALEDQRRAIANVLEDVQDEKLLISKQADDLRKFRTAAEQSYEMMIFADSEGIVQWANQATEKITGFTVKEAVNRKAGLLWGKLMNKDWYSSMWKTIKTDKKVFVSEIENHRKNGERFTSIITIYPLTDSVGDVQFFVATQRDVTHEKEIDRMKTDFISLASHQLRTPLSAMKWFLEMLMAGDMGELSKEQKDAIDNVEQSNERMISLVNGLLDISRIESGRIIVDPIPTDLMELTNSITKELDQKIRTKKQTLIISGNEKLPSIMLDPKLIRQVILNLLTNANKYTQEGGEITIFISRKNEEIIIQISDNGYGIPTTEQSKIFARFFRASNILKMETDGTGLGLYLAKAIVESSGGKIWFKSTEGQGTSFWFTLPITGMKAKAGEVRLS